jgi:hypothetical protein
MLLPDKALYFHHESVVHSDKMCASTILILLYCFMYYVVIFMMTVFMMTVK